MQPAAVEKVDRYLAGRARWGALEYVFWLLALASIWHGYLHLPERYLILTEIAWLGLFALSLDLILGYAGIISLGHAAFFGLGSYVAALLAKHGIINEPVLALVVAGLAAAVLGFATSFLVLRGSDLARLMVTLGVALIMREIANQIPDITGGADGLQGVVVAPILGTFQLDIFGHVAYTYCLIVLFILFLLERHPGRRASGWRLYACRVLRRSGRRVAGTDDCVRLARCILVRALGRSPACPD